MTNVIIYLQFNSIFFLKKIFIITFEAQRPHGFKQATCDTTSGYFRVNAPIPSLLPYTSLRERESLTRATLPKKTLIKDILILPRGPYLKGKYHGVFDLLLKMVK